MAAGPHMEEAPWAHQCTHPRQAPPDAIHWGPSGQALGTAQPCLSPCPSGSWSPHPPGSQWAGRIMALCCCCSEVTSCHQVSLAGHVCGPWNVPSILLHGHVASPPGSPCPGGCPGLALQAHFTASLHLEQWWHRGRREVWGRGWKEAGKVHEECMPNLTSSS